MQNLPSVWREVRHWPPDQRLALARRLLESVQRDSVADANAAALAEMAADPQVQRELAQIALEFAATEMDGLEER